MCEPSAGALMFELIAAAAGAAKTKPAAHTHNASRTISRLYAGAARAVKSRNRGRACTGGPTLF
jgi:hypothetical protein